MKEKIDKYQVIVATHDPLFPIRGGGAIRTLRVAEAFRDNGHRVVLLVPAGGKDELCGIRTISLPPPSKQRSQILSAVKFNIRLLLRLSRLAGRADIFFSHNTIAALSVPWLKRFFKFRFVLDITDIHAEYLPVGRRNLPEAVLTPHLLRYEYFIIRSADAVIVATQAMKEYLLSKGIARDRIMVAYDGVDKEDIPRRKEDGAQFGVIHLGAIDRQHNVETIIASIPFVVREFTGVKFFFVGGGRELPNVKRLAARLGVSEHCVFTDLLPCAASREFLKKASIGIIPRKDILPNRIITTLKIYEYWASGTAVLSSPLKGIMEVASDNQNILSFSPESARDLGEKINFLMRNTEFRDKLIAGGFECIDHTDFRKTAEQIAEFSCCHSNGKVNLEE